MTKRHSSPAGEAKLKRVTIGLLALVLLFVVVLELSVRFASCGQSERIILT